MASASSRREPSPPPGDRLDAALGAVGWRLLLDPAAPAALPAAALRPFAQRLAQAVGLAQAAAALAEAEQRQGLRLLDPAPVAQARLLARHARHHQLAALRLLADRGIEGVVIKGFDFAHRLYADPLDRIGSDLDLVLRAEHLADAVAALRAAGWRPGRSVVPAWGSIARHALPPLLSPDEATQIDLHRAADEWPFDRLLPVAALFARAERFDCGGLALLAPRPADSLLLLVSNLGKDKFGPFAVRKLLDAARLIGRHAPDPAEAARRAGAAWLGRPLRTLGGLLRALGQRLPPGWPEAPAGPDFARLLADTRGLALRAPRGLALIRREFALAADTPVALRRNLRRARGLLTLAGRRD